MNTFFDSNGIQRKWEHVRAADNLIKIKRASGSSPWPVIEEAIKIFRTYHPTEWKSYIVELDGIRKTRKDPKYASTKDKVTGGYLRYTLDIPERLVFIIRAVYDRDELPMNREFFIEFARRFPVFKVAEKL